MTNEVRTTSSTGGQKGVKDERFDLIPIDALTQLARHYGVGARKYDDNQWRKGYEWSKSYAALLRHLTQWWNGEDIDEETGSSHLVAVAWHAFTLLTFEKDHPQFDDRYTANENPILDLNLEKLLRDLPQIPKYTPVEYPPYRIGDYYPAISQPWVSMLFGEASNGQESARELMKQVAHEYVEPIDFWDTPDGEATGRAMDEARVARYYEDSDYEDELADWEYDLLHASEPVEQPGVVNVIFNGFVGSANGEVERVGTPVYLDPATGHYTYYNAGDN